MGVATGPARTEHSAVAGDVGQGRVWMAVGASENGRQFQLYWAPRSDLKKGNGLEEVGTVWTRRGHPNGISLLVEEGGDVYLVGMTNEGIGHGKIRRMLSLVGIGGDRVHLYRLWTNGRVVDELTDGELAAEYDSKHVRCRIGWEGLCSGGVRARVSLRSEG